MTNVGIIGDKTITQLRSDISSIPNFCRKETSIEVTDLKMYIGDGITLYSLNSGTLSGVINFDVNVDKITVSGLCVPGPSTGVGTRLINAVKTFAESNGIKVVNLTCYGSVVNFYTRNGFRIQSQRIVKDDSDDDSDDEDYEPKTRYNMSYALLSGGKKKIELKRIKLKKIELKRIEKLEENQVDIINYVLVKRLLIFFSNSFDKLF
jgi:hypothetical protein